MRRVLVVEDNPADVYLLERALREVAPDVHLDVLDDGGAAARYLRQHGGPGEPDALDLVILDLSLPGADGAEILREARQGRLRDTPVVIFTTSNAPADRERCLLAGADLFATKPTRYRLLVEQVRGWVDRYL